ncbi:MAG: TonB-dependent receptor [Flavobacteriales bacterium]|nr:TonB-dependent receptor [Flavobacteriales bacterium]
MKRMLTLALVLGTGGMMTAQSLGEIKGRVLAPEGEPAFNAVVETSAGGMRVASLTDDEGRFTLKPLPPGAYSVRITSTEFQPIEIEGVIVNADQISYVPDVSTSAKELGELVVTHRRWEPPLIDRDIPGRTTLFHTQFRKDPTRKNPVKLASTITPGVYKSPNSDELYFKGSRADAMVYFVDGVKMNTLRGVPPDAINSISVYTGGVPAKYGDFTGGVIAIETKTYFDLYQQRQAGIH